MEREETEETEEKESVRKTEKERYEMKYKVGDKVRVRSDLKNTVLYGGLYAVDEMLKKKIVTITSVHDDYYKVVEDDYKWTDGMLEGLVEDELTAEEAIKILGEICCENKCFNGCPIGKARGKMSCHFFRRDKPKEVLEILKQFKKDHEKKEVETEFACIVRVIEDLGDSKRCVYEEDLAVVKGETFRMAMERVLKEYCKEHEGKFFAVYEEICRVKE